MALAVGLQTPPMIPRSTHRWLTTPEERRISKHDASPQPLRPISTQRPTVSTFAAAASPELQRRQAAASKPPGKMRSRAEYARANPPAPRRLRRSRQMPATASTSQSARRKAPPVQ